MVLKGRVEENTYADVSLTELAEILTKIAESLPSIDANNLFVKFQVPGVITRTVTVKFETSDNDIPSVTIIPVCSGNGAKV